MAPTDLAWFEMDRDDNPMVVAAVLEFDGLRSLPRFIDVLAGRLERQVRFRQRADDSCRPALWIGCERIDRRYHFAVQALEGPQPRERLRRRIARELVRPLDRDRPLWRLHFFPQPRGRVTVLFRAHHAMADGVSLLRVLLRLADDAPPATPPPEAPPATVATRRGPLAPAIYALAALDQALLGLQGFARRAGEQPAEALRSTAAAVRSALLTVRMLGAPNRNPPGFRAPLAGTRVVEWSAPRPLQPLKEAARRRGVTLNDLFLTALAAAFGRCLGEAGPLHPKQDLRISIPVNLRAAEHDDAFGNCFGLVLFDLPVGALTPNARLQRVAQRMRRLKHSPEARAILALLDAAGRMPVTLQKQLVGWVSGKAAVVVSNLRGPEDALRFAGARLNTVVFWPPQTGHSGVGVSLLSYAGQVTLGLSCDTGILRNPQRIVAAFETELAALLQTEQESP